MKMKQKFFIFGEDPLNKYAFQKNENPINIDEVNIKRMVLSKKVSYDNKGSFKYIIGYVHKGGDFPATLYIKLTKMNGYTKYFDNNNRYMNFLANDKKLLKKQ